jgi:hypothetical protein
MKPLSLLERFQSNRHALGIAFMVPAALLLIGLLQQGTRNVSKRSSKHAPILTSLHGLSLENSSC